MYIQYINYSIYKHYTYCIQYTQSYIMHSHPNTIYSTYKYTHTYTIYYIHYILHTLYTTHTYTYSYTITYQGSSHMSRYAIPSIHRCVE